MMGIERTIKGLETIGKYGLNNVGNKPFIESAIAFLETHPDNQPNEPLTADELQGMIGKPVYYPDVEEWKIVDEFAIRAVYCDGAKLYRRSPKEGSDDCRPAAEIFAGIERKAEQSLAYHKQITDCLNSILDEKSDISIEEKIELIRTTVVEWLSDHLAT